MDSFTPSNSMAVCANKHIPSDNELISASPTIGIEFLKAHGINENSLNQTITTLEKISELIDQEKCVWTNNTSQNTVPSQMRRLKWAAKKLLSSIDGYKNKIIVDNKRRNQKLKRLLSRNISDKSGICRLRKEKAEKLQKIFEDAKQEIENSGNLVAKSEIDMQQNEIEISPDTKPVVYPNPQICYICKSSYSRVHFFYDQMCSTCGDVNFAKRTQSAELDGKIALVTGGRIKIGYEVVLKLLRCGISHVVTTTRFPHDAARRFANEHDYTNWKHRLDIYGLDLRFLWMVESFCDHVSKTYPRLDILIQNAAQTIRRPPTFYAHLICDEIRPLPLSYSHLVKFYDQNQIHFNELRMVQNQEAFPPSCLNSSSNDLNLCSSDFNLKVYPSPSSNVPMSALASQLIIHPDDTLPENKNLFPAGQFDNDHQQLDLRLKNSWLLEAPEVDKSEVVEVSIINSISPFIILNKLTPLLKNSCCSPSKFSNSKDTKYGWIILVSAMEGQFYRAKSSRHPHTNCAKAYLNMLVRTSSSYYAKYNLLMNSVDTGWITDEVPFVIRQRNDQNTNGGKKMLIPPLDEVDGAARILDPIFQTIIHGIKEHGKFYKNYKETLW